MDSLVSLFTGSREGVLSLVLAWVVPSLLQHLKASPLPIMQEGARRLNTVVAAAVATLATVGVHVLWSTDASGWHLTLEGAHASVGAFVIDVLRQFLLQQGRYLSMSAAPGGGGVLGVLRRLLGAVVLVAAAGAAIGCASGHRPALTVPAVAPALAVPASVPVDQAVRAASIKALGILEAAGVLTEQVVDLEARLAPVIPAAVHRDFTASVNALAKRALSTIDAIERGAVVSWPALKAQVDPLLAMVARLVELVQSLPQMTSSRFGFAGVVSALASVLGKLQALGLFEPAPASVGVTR
jgi:hypothetical protein